MIHSKIALLTCFSLIFLNSYCFSFAATPANEKIIIELTGTLIPGGVECQLFQADSGDKYTIVGDLNGIKNGDKVRLTGEVAQISHCMQEITIIIKTIIIPDSPDQ